MKRTKRERLERLGEYHTKQREVRKHTLGRKKLMHLIARMTDDERKQFFSRKTPSVTMAESAMRDVTVPATDSFKDQPTIKL